MQCLVIVSIWNTQTSEREKYFGVSKDFGQCTGENWSPVQDMTEIGWQVFAHISCQSLFKGGARAPPPKSAPVLFPNLIIGSYIMYKLNPGSVNYLIT